MDINKRRRNIDLAAKLLETVAENDIATYGHLRSTLKPNDLPAFMRCQEATTLQQMAKALRIMG